METNFKNCEWPRNVVWRSTPQRSSDDQSDR